MSTDFGLRYGATELLNMTVNSLANGTYRQSSGVVNTSGWTDYAYSCKLSGPTSSTSTNGYVAFWALGSSNNGASYTEGGSGIDASFVPASSPLNMAKLGFVSIGANNTVVEAGPFSVAAAFNGVMPRNFQIVIGNFTGATLNSTGNSGWLQPCKIQGI